MAHPRAQSLRRGGPLPRLWIDSSPTSHRRSLCSPSSPFSSTHVSAATTLSDTPFSPDAFNVLCLYDYEAADADQLSFRKNEILEIIKREESGWWAAMRPGGYEVGWIPSAYVEAISERVANRPCGTQNSRTSIDELTRAHHPSLSTKHSGPYIATPAGESHGHHWMPLLDEDQAPLFRLFSQPSQSDTKDITSSVFGPLVPPHDGVDEFILGPETEPPSMRGMMARLRLPATEMPPPLPAKDSSSIQKHTSSPSTAPIVSDHSRSYSEPGSPAISRHLRRRPVLIDDRGSLSRLSTLFETNNIEELDSLIGSPVIAGSFDAFSRKGGASTKWTDGCEAAPRDHEVPVLQPTPLLLSTRSSYGEHELQTQPGGSVAAGSLRALLDKLTSDSHESAQEKFQRIFLMTFRTFASADEVSYYLIKRYHIGYPIADKHVQEKKAHTTQERVLAIIKMWYEEYGMLQDDSHISSHLMDFTSSVMAPSPLAATAHTISESLLRLTLPKPAIPTSAPTKRKDSKTSKINLFHLDPTHVAEQLCLYEHSLYRQIRPQECLNRVKTTAGDSGITNITAFCSTRHRLVTWVKTSILSTEEVRERAATIDFWIRVAEVRKFYIHPLEGLNSYVYCVVEMQGTQQFFHHERAGRRSLQSCHLAAKSDLDIRLAQYDLRPID
ncbi:hypothetical protein AcW1_001177 [Taiwanofungus camphoratus]|nr:hypothetical protein AcV7_001198 [Antrodia cinnamomea]KAI0964334.1 hypothetical protein AcW1_001177 [Antrodia cinnamomea]